MPRKLRIQVPDESLLIIFQLLETIGANKMRKKYFRLVALTAVNGIAAYLSLKSLGGFLVFGVGNSFAAFCLFAVPVLALPIALIAWWRIRFAAFLWGFAMVLFFGVQVSLVCPEVHRVAHNGTHFLAFSAGCILLLWAAISEVPGKGRADKKENLRERHNQV
jgi:hypothetical protein